MGYDMGHMKVLLFEPLVEGAAPPDAQLNSGFVHGNGQEHRQVLSPPIFLSYACKLARIQISHMQISTNTDFPQLTQILDFPRCGPRLCNNCLPTEPFCFVLHAN